MDLIDVEEVVVPATETDIPAWRPGDAFVAGGTWLFSEPQPGLLRLIDLTRIPVEPVVRSDGMCAIAATCTYQTLYEQSALLESAATAFDRGIKTLSSSFKTWPVATVGGNVCLAYAKAMMAPLFCALDATYELVDAGRTVRTVAAREFQTGMRTTVRRPGEYLRRIVFGEDVLGDSFALRSLSYTKTSHATAMVTARVPRLSRTSRATLVVSAATACPVTVAVAPDATTAAVVRAVDAVCDRHALLDDGHGGPEYRRSVLAQLAADAWDEAQRVHG